MRQPLPVLTAVTGRWEAAVAVALDGPGSGVEVVRRCADLGELLSAAAAGLGRAAVISADLQRLDRSAIAQLLAAPIAIVGLTPPGDDAAAVRLNRIGVTRVLTADAPAHDISDALLAAFRELQDHLRQRPPSGPAPLSAIHGSAGEGPDRDLTSSPAVRSADDARAASTIGLAHPLGPAPWAGSSRLPMGDPSAGLPAAPRIPPGGAARADLAGASSEGKLIAIWGPVGAPGRTTVAITLAAEIAGCGRQCLLVDADTYGASIAQSLGLLDESAGLAAAARAANQGQLDVAKLGELAPFVGRRLRVLTGLPQPRRWAELRPSSLDIVWDEARRLADCTVVDAGFGLDADEEMMFDTAAPRRHGATLSAVSGADLVVAVGAGDPIGLQRLLGSLADLRDVTGVTTPVQVVITKVRDQAIGGSAAARVRGALERYAHVTDPVIIPDDRTSLDAAMLAGRTLAEVAPSSPACLAVRALAERLLEPGGVLDDGRGVATGPERRNHSRGRWRRRKPAVSHTE